MKFTCEKNLLQAAVSTTSKAAAVKSPMQGLDGILLETGQERLKLTGYDLKKGIYTHIEGNILEPGSIVLGARMLSSIVNALPEGTVTVAVSGLNAVITCGSAEFSIIGTDAAEYPELPDINGQSSVSLPQNLLGRMIRQTIFAVSDNESRPVYTGELFEFSGGQLTLVAVDGYRLALRRESVEGLTEEQSFIVPGTALSDLEKLCADTEDPVRISVGDKHISFTIGETVLVSRRLEGDFLNYRKTVPTDFRIRVRADRSTMQRTMERVSLIIDDRIKNPLRCTFGENEIHTVCVTSLGKAEDFISVEGDGDGLVIGFNNRYLLDALKAAPAEEIRVCLNTGSSPCVILPPEDTDEFLYMILPVRLKAE